MVLKCRKRIVLLGIRHFSQALGHSWYQPPEVFYEPDRILQMSLPGNKCIEAKILKAYLPFTNSACILVQPLYSVPDLPRTLICKLADRRVGERSYLPWSIDHERQFQTHLTMYVERTGAHPEVDEYGRLSEDDPEWFAELVHWGYFDKARRAELKAYEALAPAQKLGLVPKCFGPVRIAMSSGSSIHPSLDAIDGLLTEYIPGRLMSSIRPGTDISIEEAEDISQRILELARRVRRHSVSHNDLHSNNIILRYGSNEPVLIDWGRAAFHALSEKTFAARWTDLSMYQDFHSDIRKILMRSDGNIWHRFTTPLSNAAQIMLARERSWKAINRSISDLPEEQLEMMYYEDPNVHRERGLRWRVKPGMKTTTMEWDDPVPPY